MAFILSLFIPYHPSFVASGGLGFVVVAVSGHLHLYFLYT